MAFQPIPTIYQQGEYNRRQTGERWKTCILATDLKYRLRGSTEGTMTDPCSHKTTKREFNPESYRMNEKGDPGYLFILPFAEFFHSYLSSM